MLVTTQWPLKRAAHLTSLVWVCVLWLPWKLNGAICAMRGVFRRKCIVRSTGIAVYIFQPGITWYAIHHWWETYQIIWEYKTIIVVDQVASPSKGCAEKNTVSIATCEYKLTYIPICQIANWSNPLNICSHGYFCFIRFIQFYNQSRQSKQIVLEKYHTHTFSVAATKIHVPPGTRQYYQ